VTAVAELSDELESELAANSIVDPRTVPVRFSALKHMARSALHYHDAIQSDREQTIAMRFGAGVHAMVLDQPFVVWHGKDRRAAGYKEFAAAHTHVPILTRKEHDVAHALATAILQHPIAAPLLFDAGAILEQQIAWQWGDRACTSRPDSRRGSEILVDLKTTQCAEPGKFERDASFRGYHAQLAFYELAIEHATGTAPRESFVVAVESKRPHAITVLRLTDEARDAGQRLCRTWFERLLVCEASNTWPAYSESVCQLGVIDGDYGITIDGVAFTEEQP
jgi:hypothetical protein